MDVRDNFCGRAGWQQIAGRIRVPLGFCFSGIYFWFARPSRHSLAAGLLLVAPGLALRACASGYLRKNTELTMTGPYAYTRNPLYLGSLLLACGSAVAARNLWLAVALAVLFAVIYWPTILGEEAGLRDRFPEFAEYASKVPRLLPRRLPWGRPGAGAARGRFSWALYREHREYNSLCGSIILFLALIVGMLWRQRTLR
ncbi:MAG: methyltransferase family protein [Candidatus Krumholzibacteriia bacterium]